MVFRSFRARARASQLTRGSRAAREIVDSMRGTHRLLLHGRSTPNQTGDVEDMRALRDDFRHPAWKTYTQWGRTEQGFFLTDEDNRSVHGPGPPSGVWTCR